MVADQQGKLYVVDANRCRIFVIDLGLRPQGQGLGIPLGNGRRSAKQASLAHACPAQFRSHRELACGSRVPGAS